jgi:penicillin-binding protein 2
MFKKEYKISVNQDDWVAPEETLLDSASGYSNMEKPISEGVFRFLLLMMGGCFLIISIFTFRLSIVRHEVFASMSLRNKSANFSVSPPRGLIKARDGEELVKNIPSFDLLAISREIREKSDEASESMVKIAGILGVSSDDFKKSVQDSLKESSIFIAAKDLTKDQLLEISYLNPSGFYVIPDAERYYIDGHQFSSIVGYTGRVSKNDLAEDSYYAPTDIIGRLGIESEYEQALRGYHGNIIFSKDGKSLSQEPKAGDTIILNIDYKLQKKLYSELFTILAEAGLDKAAAIIQNPKNGEVLAMVSFPSFDNNLFRDGLSGAEFKSLFESKSRPLFNRTVGGLYNPGSTIKPYMGMAILDEHIFEPSDNIRDCISLTVNNPYSGQTAYVFNNWRPETGLFNLRKAIANSCNIYFFIGVGGFKNIKGLGIEKTANYLKLGLADTYLGIDLPGEDKGLVPTPDWKMKDRGEPWYQGDTYNVAIGQGDLLVTPLWLNTYISAVANGGTIYRPRVVSKITGNGEETIKKFETEAIGKLPFTSESIREVMNDMEETVLTGTAQLLKDLPVRSGAKTGTAEVIKGSRINSLFTAFAPFENPELSITILVEGSASNQGYAIRAAHNVLAWYFNNKHAE